MKDYAAFVESKLRHAPAIGVTPQGIASILFPFQRVITEWALRKGRAAIFADCGLGKTLMQLEWCKQIGGRKLIVVPLGVIQQTIDEASSKLGLRVTRVTEPTDDMIQITTYGMLRKFVGAPYAGIVLDESSILKSIDGKTRKLLLDEFTDIEHRLCCTATPAPNDIAELGNHCQFLGVLTRGEMLARFFVHDSSQSQKYRLKGHAAEAFYDWMASWACYLRNPEDIGYAQEGFDLPPLSVSEDTVSTSYAPPGFLLATGIGGVSERLKARRGTITERVEKCRQMIDDTPGLWLVWCGLNDEGQTLHKALNGQSVLVEGKHKEAYREAAIAEWKSGEKRVLITKTKIFGFGLNLQVCHQMAFLGLNDSWEQFYQAVRRCWRFGQTEPVSVRIITSTAEESVVANVKRKRKEAEEMVEQMIGDLAEREKAELDGTAKKPTEVATDECSSDDGAWRLVLGDSCKAIHDIEENSVALSVFSPPFASLYTYSDSPADMGNVDGYDEFFEHFNFLVPGLLHATMPGRRACVHVQQIAKKKVVDGVIGLYDFRADVVACFAKHGWIYDGEVVIDKNPQAQAIRTHSKQLLFAQLRKDSAWMRPALGDYILLFRKDGDNPVPIHPDVTNEEWIKWAHPIWYDIRESDTLNARAGRADKDERHICPLQLETIRRCVRLWSNKGELVLDPFSGIGSTPFVSVQIERCALGIELKQSYWEAACRNMEKAREGMLL